MGCVRFIFPEARPNSFAFRRLHCPDASILAALRVSSSCARRERHDEVSYSIQQRGIFLSWLALGWGQSKIYLPPQAY
jgi:hypothetical protein